MFIADITPRHRPELRRVWIAFDGPAQRTSAARRIYLELDINVGLEGDNVLYVETVRTAAGWYQGALERHTGHIAINDWDRFPIPGRN